MKKLWFIFFSLIIANIFTAKALADVWSSPHQWTNKDQKGYAYIPPGTTGDIRVWRRTEETFTPDKCGFVSFESGGNTKQVVSIYFDHSNIERIGTEQNIEKKPTCIQQKDGSWKSEFQGSAGTLLKTSVSYHFYAPGGPVDIEITRKVKINRNPNKCGYTVVTSSRWSGVGVDTFEVGGVVYTDANLPKVKYPRVCWGNGDDKVIYTPNIY
jgi:hypothetical protein